MPSRSMTRECHDIPFPNSSLLVYLDKELHEAKEIWSWSHELQHFNNSHPLQRRKNCSNTNDSIPDRTETVWSLLAYYFEYGSLTCPGCGNAITRTTIH
jgi:hypothetical protein